MTEIKDNNGEVLHIIHKLEDILSERTNLTQDKEILQICSMRLPKKKFKAHYHLPTKRTNIGTAECWIVILGSIKVFYYDKDKNLIETRILYPGDCTLTLNNGGGHNYEILEDDTLVYEIKSGPYFGVEIDKAFIND